MDYNKREGTTVIGFIFKFMSAHWKWAILSIFLSSSSVIVALLQTHLMKNLINRTVAGNWSWDTALFFLSLVFVSAAVAGLSHIAIGKLGAYSAHDLKLMLSNRFIHTDYKNVQSISSGDAVSTLNNDCARITSFLSGDVISLPTQILTAVSAFIYLLVLNPKLGLITFAYTPIGMFLANRVTKRMNSLYPVAADQKGIVLNNVEQSLSSLQVIKSFGMYNRSMKRLNATFEDLYKTDLKIKFWDTLMQPACLSIANTPTLVFSIVGGLQALDGRLELGTFVAVTRLIGYIVPTTVMLPFMLNNLNRTKASIQRVNRILDLPQNDSQVIEKVGKDLVPSVVVKNLSFGYELDRPVLKDTSFELKKPGITVVVGSSGSGKTTLISLLSGLYRPDSGSIQINGYDTSKLTDINIGSLVSVLPQDIYVFSDNILNNIRVGKIDSDDREVIKVAEVTGVSEFIEQKEKGFQTMLGQGGNDLSGGQAQKLALARAYLKNAPIWILDEPTSALDGVSESKLHNLLSELSQRKIVFVAAHRLSTIQLADQIIYLKDGRIEGFGTWKELQKNKNFINTLNSDEFPNEGEVCAV
ncbi:MAG: ABC transporter ATP-binding protein [Halanaerobiales bacterium]|nr:ABC transporter ATP-binding protein [Halanaerobiales bacterium]